jgi:hypothetical protein
MSFLETSWTSRWSYSGRSDAADPMGLRLVDSSDTTGAPTDDAFKAFRASESLPGRLQRPSAENSGVRTAEDVESPATDPAAPQAPSLRVGPLLHQSPRLIDGGRRAKAPQ